MKSWILILWLTTGNQAPPLFLPEEACRMAMHEFSERGENLIVEMDDGSIAYANRVECYKPHETEVAGW